jgi:hypothetical protein
VDFFVSYTSVDRPWAEWIAWQLEAEGYRVVIQAWDFGAGRDWAHEMQHATSTADRVLVVLSPDYLQSAYGEAEWRPFYADDPTGERGLLLPVRVREVDPPGLLRTKIYVDLVERDAASARAALLAGVRGARGKPADEPEFPGGHGRRTDDGTEAPRFPGDSQSAGSSNDLSLQVTLRADDTAAISTFTVHTSDSLRQYGFSEYDIDAFRVTLHELVDNVAVHVHGHGAVGLTLTHLEPSRELRFQEGIGLTVTDAGNGFDFDNALIRAEAELVERGIEHGLLRAYRLGSMLVQASIEPHVMGWMKERTPQNVPTVFDSENVIPFVISYRQEIVQIWRDVYTLDQIGRYLDRSEAFMDLVFDPLQRPARKYVGIEVTGHGWTGALSWRHLVELLLSFRERDPAFDKQFLLFADTGPSDQRELRKYCKSVGISMFEDESAARKFEVEDVAQMNRRAKKEGPSRRWWDLFR